MDSAVLSAMDESAGQVERAGLINPAVDCRPPIPVCSDRM